MSSAAQHSTPPGTAGATTLIRTGRLLDVRSASVLEHTALLVSGDRIAAIIPAGAPEPAHDPPHRSRRLYGPAGAHRLSHPPHRPAHLRGHNIRRPAA